MLAVLRERDALRESNRRLEHLITELNQVLHGKRSEKLSDDERQLAFEDLEAAGAEAETRQDAEAAPRTPSRRTARRNLGHLPESLPRVERLIEPDSLLCPCGCGEMHRIGEDRTERLDIVPARLCCTNLMRNSCCESRVVAGWHEQTHTPASKTRNWPA